MITVNTSYINLVSQHTLAKNTDALQKATERLSTGAKINHAVDDPAGIFLDVSLSSQISGMMTANDNTLLATNFLNIANGTLTNVSDCLMRMNDLAVQACSGILSDEARSTLQNELNSLVAQANQSLNSSSMNGVSTMNVDVEGVPVTETPAQGSTPASAGDGFIGAVNQKSQAELESAGYVACTSANLAVAGNTKFYISSVAELQAFAIAVNSGTTTSGRIFTLSGDLDLSSVCSESSGTSWTAIGSTSNHFRGTFDGNGHVISNLYINKSNTANQGLFGATYGATIKNVGVENADVTGKNNTGALVGYAYSASLITDCYVTGSVKGSGNDVGGLAGSAVNISNCYSTASVKQTSSAFEEAGGLVGNAANIENSFATGNVEGGSYVGGIAGSCSSVTNCYATGNVSGSEYIGGIVGSSSSVTNCYSTGNVSGASYCSGGIRGAFSGTVQNSYATGRVNGAVASEAANKASFNASVLDDNLWDKTGDNPVLKLTQIASSGGSSSGSGGSGGSGGSSSSSSVIRLQVGDTADLTSAIEYNASVSLNFEDLDLSSIENARVALTKIQANLQEVTAKQSYIGTQINRLSNIYNSQQIRIENVSAAKSTISDTDYAKEVANMVKSQILQQISVSVLTQSQNISGKIALSLL